MCGGLPFLFYKLQTCLQNDPEALNAITFQKGGCAKRVRELRGQRNSSFYCVAAWFFYFTNETFVQSCDGPVYTVHVCVFT